MAPKHRRWRFHGLKRPKIRQDWNKYNLYNLHRLKAPNTANRTFFQQKWTAKAATRAYHGEQILEKHWKRMFSKITPAVVPMDPKYLAENDGSEHASGRGSGRDLAPGTRKSLTRRTPYAQMVYFPTERRLDTAIFRALFASSARQARQHVVHGHVKVNGKKMIYPGYLLNPGDLFSVNPVRVLKTTGLFMHRQHFYLMNKQKLPEAKAMLENEQVTETEEEIENEDLTEDESSIPTSDESLANTKRSLLHLRKQASALLEKPPKGKELSARQKQDVRAFKKTLKQSLSRAHGVSPSAMDDLEAEFQAISSRVAIAGEDEQATTSEASIKALEPDVTASEPPTPGSTSLEDTETLKDHSLRWRPKDYMPAFAFVPRYLEVHYGICSAVYLRHPVCKPGFSEVPTPFHPETGRLAFNWYLRRR